MIICYSVLVGENSLYLLVMQRKEKGEEKAGRREKGEGRI